MRSLMTGFLLQLCAVHRLSFALFNESRYLTPVQHKALVARAAVAATRLRRRRANNRAPATHLQKRRKVLGCHSFNKILISERHLDMTSRQEIRRRSSVAADRVPEKSVLAAAIATASSTNAPARDRSGAHQEKTPNDSSKNHRNDKMDETMPPPPSRTASVKRHTRSQSAACRQVNRLSLTLPIAPPTSDPSRPTPTSTTMSSIPPTPIDSGIISPMDTDEFIIAIAAQERKVLELREELLRAEGDLNQLKKKWCSMDAPNKRGEQRPAEPIHSAASTSDDETRRSGELDRKKFLLQHQNHNHAQNQDQNTPGHNRRRVMRGGHTRTLSLLSSPKLDSPGFPQPQEDRKHEPAKVPLERRPSQLAHHNLSKRASWQPRTQQTIPGYPQIVEDFKLGLRAFVEDIRQITVGDEPINGQQPTRSTAVDYRNNTNKDSPSNQDTIKASQAPRPKVSNIFDSPNSNSSTPKSMVRTKTAPPEKEKPKAGKNKHFSWTPLGFDAVDDDAWSNWESPSSVKSSRWSGSTVGSGGLGDVPALEEEGGQTSTPIKKKPATAETPRTPKLDEILPNMVNRFTPSNIKRTATNLLDEWEKSLIDPENPIQNKENTA